MRRPMSSLAARVQRHDVREHLGDDRGVSLVEYAMGIALVALVMVAAANGLANSGREELSSRGGTAAASSEIIGELRINSTPPTTSPSGGGGGGSPTDVVSASVDPIQVQVTQGNGQKWNMTVTIRVVDASGAPLQNAVVDGSWGSGLATQCPATDSLGVCVLTLQNISHHTATMDFTLGVVSYTNASGAPAPVITYPLVTTVTATNQ